MKRKDKISPPSKKNTESSQDRSLEELSDDYQASKQKTTLLKRQLYQEQRYQSSLVAASQNLKIDKELLHQTYKTKKGELVKKFNSSQNRLSTGMFTTIATINAAAFLSSLSMLLLGKEDIGTGSLAFNGFFALLHGFFAYDAMKERKSALKSINTSVTDYQKRLEFHVPK